MPQRSPAPPPSLPPSFLQGRLKGASHSHPFSFFLLPCRAPPPHSLPPHPCTAASATRAPALCWPYCECSGLLCCLRSSSCPACLPHFLLFFFAHLVSAPRQPLLPLPSPPFCLRHSVHRLPDRASPPSPLPSPLPPPSCSTVTPAHHPSVLLPPPAVLHRFGFVFFSSRLCLPLSQTSLCGCSTAPPPSGYVLCSRVSPRSRFCPLFSLPLLCSCLPLGTPPLLASLARFLFSSALRLQVVPFPPLLLPARPIAEARVHRAASTAPTPPSPRCSLRTGQRESTLLLHLCKS